MTATGMERLIKCTIQDNCNHVTSASHQPDMSYTNRVRGFCSGIFCFVFVEENVGLCAVCYVCFKVDVLLFFAFFMVGVQAG